MRYFHAASQFKFTCVFIMLWTCTECHALHCSLPAVFFYNFGWQDYGVGSLTNILDMVKVMQFALSEGKVAVHCHAGLGELFRSLEFSPLISSNQTCSTISFWQKFKCLPSWLSLWSLFPYLCCYRQDWGADSLLPDLCKQNVC